MKKKGLALLMVAVLSASLAACSGNSSSSSSSAASSASSSSSAASESSSASSESSSASSSSSSSSSSESTTSGGGGSLKVGVVAGITGSDPLEGERMQEGIELAVQEYQEEGGSVEIELDIYDSKGTTDGALNAVQKCISDGCQVIVGPHKSTQVLAVGDVADEAQIPFISGGTSPNLFGKFDYLFTCRTNDTYAAMIGAQECVDYVEATKVGIFYGSDDYGSGGYQVASAYFDENGIEYVSETYKLNYARCM